ncbi:MAG: methyltransferase domain-containing protein [Oscillospiraceae bacterium]|nr:methyltransferase domain-containing protein [Oscillospiraceae bacterium]
MSCYDALAPWYDSLTGDVPYSAIADLYEEEFKADGGEFRLLLDLCCGTGSMTWELARRGYEMIAADRSVEMLMQAQAKQESCRVRPLFLCQAAEELDLYGTVDAAVCCLDGFNYIPLDTLGEVFGRLRLFVRPGGLLIFDVRTPEFLRSLDGQVFVDEQEDVLCLWRADFDADAGALVYGMDLFTRRGRLWERQGEEHVEYAHAPEALQTALEAAGFGGIRLRRDGPQGDAGRLYIIAERR